MRTEAELKESSRLMKRELDRMYREDAREGRQFVGESATGWRWHRAEEMTDGWVAACSVTTISLIPLIGILPADDIYFITYSDDHNRCKRCWRNKP